MAAPAFSRAHHQQALHHTKGRNLADKDIPTQLRKTKNKETRYYIWYYAPMGSSIE